MLAADLIAQPFAYAMNNSYRRVVILCPEHFRRAKSLVSVPDRDFRTATGVLELDREAAASVLRSPKASVSSLFSHEHGIQAVLPFIALRWPDAKVLPLALRGYRDKDGLDELAGILAPMAGEGTLFVQSTDFSHYLTADEAALRDAESRKVIMDMDPGKAYSLHQPDNVDSVAALYVLMSLQRALGAKPKVLSVRNSCSYAPEGGCAAITSTTSYIVAAFELPEKAGPEKAGPEKAGPEKAGE
jgi:poly-gamma-glutamate synthesis protein (capsule biosynthesis protein)